MKILVIGATGTIGRYVAQHFAKNHEVLHASRNAKKYRVNIDDAQSIKNLFTKTGQLDAIICAAGEARWDDFHDLTEEDYYIGIKSKLMGQVNLVRIGLDHLNENGSITLTTGILEDDPVVKTASAAMVNGAIHSFVQAASLEMKAGQRVNAVSSGVVSDAYEKYIDYFPGHNPIPMEKMILGYDRSVLGKTNGQVIRIYD